MGSSSISGSATQVPSSHSNESLGCQPSHEEITPRVTDDLTTIQSPSSDTLTAKGDDKGSSRLLPHESDILDRQVSLLSIPYNPRVLYRYASTSDKTILAASILLAIIAGAAIPLMTLVFGGLQKEFMDFFAGRVARDDFMDRIDYYIQYFVYLGIVEFITQYLTTVGFMYTGEHITGSIREKYLESCVRQNIGFFDVVGTGELSTQIASHTNLIQDGISEKVSITLVAVSTFVSAFVISFAKDWKLTLMLFSLVMGIIIDIALGSRVASRFTGQSMQAYAQGGNIADAVFRSIRSTVAFGAQERVSKQYRGHLLKSEALACRGRSIIAISVAGMMFLLYLTYGLAFWQGSSFLIHGNVAIQDVLTIIMSVVLGAFSLGSVASNLQAFTAAAAAASDIFSIIDRQSPIDPYSDDGNTLDMVNGTIRLTGIKHVYPSRPDVIVLDGFDLTIPAGKTTAIVGASGSGKSSIIGLIEKFYQPVSGVILLDDHDINGLNLKWLRRQMALVGQEPMLFRATIFENICAGLKGTHHENSDRDKKRQLVIEAAQKSNAYDFISTLPDGLDTLVGEGGSHLSGSQKQRIAIARAIIFDPKILLLDEATSALDSESESVVQAALRAASKGRTTITIAHRLSTVKHADNIILMADGKIIEQGTHDALIGRKGAYHRLSTAQDPSLVSKAILREHSHVNGKDLADTKIGIAELGLLPRRGSVPHAGSDSDLQPESIAQLRTPEPQIFFAKQLSVLSQHGVSADDAETKHNSDYWSELYLMLACVQFVAFAAQGLIFANTSERLIRRARDTAFRMLLKQDISFFDQDHNNAGALTHLLSTGANQLAGLSGITLGTLVMVITTLVTAITVSAAIGWRLSLVCTATVPILLACGFLRFWLLSRFQQRAKAAYESSASFASEVVASMRTVASLSIESDIISRYKETLKTQQQQSLISVAKSSVLYAAAQSLLFLCFALGYWYGASLIAGHDYTLFQFFLCFMAVSYGAQSAGVVFSFAPDMGKACQAASEFKKLHDCQPAVDASSSSGRHVETIEGSIESINVHFQYPSRPGVPVLRGLDISIRAGQYVAFVGSSGCGKSTTISLLERFYDATSGAIYVDGQNIHTLNVTNWRSHLALVSQEPTLYPGTIRDNIQMGSLKDCVSEDAIELACREANIHDFVLSLPEGLNTSVGDNGVLLSGGQKQRIAIARALIRRPKVLLLDEATSALDQDSERSVQLALDNATRSRTTIVVAHRLSTIAKADVIYVFDAGRVVECGSHDELMAANGRYAEMVSLQSVEN
ncbi:ABC multidrug transporter mdr1 [Colletotrichum kahawae]|uniref:ABC multidrug transporter mdr1 n=1 Tax=Colletotrichum kahawae TaxID=34407 RepID=A0AAE0CXY4_COLKA|nr:ABC multidrug transporter mdr1 [Colletotrichum kahawae]